MAMVSVPPPPTTVPELPTPFAARVPPAPPAPAQHRVPPTPPLSPTAAATRATDLADGDAVAGLARGPAGATQAASHLDDVIVETGDDVSGAAESACATDATRAAAVTAATGTADAAVERTSRF
jgi:hypothetical protein